MCKVTGRTRPSTEDSFIEPYIPSIPSLTWLHALTEETLPVVRKGLLSLTLLADILPARAINEPNLLITRLESVVSFICERAS